jgi:amino acid transporter
VKKLSLFSLTLLIVASVGSIRTLPTTAVFGGSLVFYFALAALLFLIPVSLVAAEMASRFPEEGGIFHWVRQPFGERAGALAVWLQWINTMVWYPTMLLFVAGTSAYLLDPALAHHPLFLMGVGLATFWGLTLLNLRSVQVSARVNAICGVLGTFVPLAILVGLAIRWVANGLPLALFNTPSGVADHWLSQSTALITVMASLLGMELAGVHIRDVTTPQRTFPRAIGLSVILLLGMLMTGALSIAAVIPSSEIQFVDGVMQTFSSFFQAAGARFVVPIMAGLIVLGSLGGSINWLISPAQGLLQVAQHQFLPPFFALTNSRGVPVRILVVQALLISLFCLAILFVPSLNALYWFLMALSTALYMLMYILLFAAALKMGRSRAPGVYQIPRSLRTVSCWAGIVGCGFTLGVGFFPPPSVEIGSISRYITAVAGGLIAMIAPILWFWRYQRAQTAYQLVLGRRSTRRVERETSL